MSNDLSPYSADQYADQSHVLLRAVSNKDTISRMRRYVSYLEAYGLEWWRPDLAKYRDHLRGDGLAESSVRAHLSTIRSRYRRVIRQRDEFYAMLPELDNIADAKSVVDEMIVRIENAIHPGEAQTSVTEIQDTTDREHVWLEPAEIAQLLSEPVLRYGDEPVAWRDASMLALMVTTGVREAELCALNLDDLWRFVDSEPCLLVRHGKGNKQRAIPYGENLTGIEILKTWIDYLWSRGIGNDDDAVFWSFWRNNRVVRGRLSTRSVGAIVRSYGIMRTGEIITVSPHDLRRTYARTQYHAGLSLWDIAQNMGHRSIEETKRYIGNTSIGTRRNRMIF